GQVAALRRFSRDPAEVIGALATYFGSATSFPLDLYRSRYATVSTSDDRERHVVVLSDDGLESMFGVGNEPFVGAARVVREVLTTGTLVLMDRQRRVAKSAAEAGYDVVYIASMDDAPKA